MHCEDEDDDNDDMHIIEAKQNRNLFINELIGGSDCELIYYR